MCHARKPLLHGTWEGIYLALDCFNNAGLPRFWRAYHTYHVYTPSRPTTSGQLFPSSNAMPHACRVFAPGHSLVSYLQSSMYKSPPITEY